MIKSLFVGVIIGFGLAPSVIRADAVGLELAPLEYQQTISAKTPQQGFIDVSNPSDSSVDVTTSVEGFRQIDADGNLSYYTDPVLTAAIVPGLASFTIGARQAVNVAFTVDPSKLPAGGIYAVIFFQTVPVAQSSSSSFVSESARVGTLLVLNNGGMPVAGGHASLGLSRLQLGSGISGAATYSVADGQVGLTPNLATKVYSWGKKTGLTTGLVLPGSHRSFDVSRPGSYFGLIPVQLIDATTGRTTTAWVIAITGWYQTLVAFLIALALALAFRRWRRPQDSIADIVAHPLDGLSRRD